MAMVAPAVVARLRRPRCSSWRSDHGHAGYIPHDSVTRGDDSCSHTRTSARFGRASLRTTATVASCASHMHGHSVGVSRCLMPKDLLDRRAARHLPGDVRQPLAVHVRDPRQLVVVHASWCRPTTRPGHHRRGGHDGARPLRPPTYRFRPLSQVTLGSALINAPWVSGRKRVGAVTGRSPPSVPEPASRAGHRTASRSSPPPQRRARRVGVCAQRLRVLQPRQRTVVGPSSLPPSASGSVWSLVRSVEGCEGTPKPGHHQP